MKDGKERAGGLSIVRVTSVSHGCGGMWATAMLQVCVPQCPTAAEGVSTGVFQVCVPQCPVATEGGVS